MVTGVEGIGEAVTGGMLARAIEPEAGEDGHTHEMNCLNCGAKLQGPYCQQCGQKGHVHRTLGAFWHDLIHGVLHFEGKIWRTLPPLAWRPGELTHRYVHGERAQFVSPIALFLFSVFLMFAVLSLVGGPFTTTGDAQASREAGAGIQRERNQLDRRIAGLERQRRETAARRQPTTAIDAELRRARQEQRLLGAAESIVLVPSSAPEGTTKSVDLREAEIDTGWALLDRGIAKAQENPSLLIYKLQNNAYKFSWALIPISVPLVWLLFLHRRRYRAFKAYDHVVFVTYSIAFMSLLLIALSLLRPLGFGEVLTGFALTLVPPIHMYRQLRGAYGLSRFSAIWRTAMLILFAIWSATIFFLLLMAMGVLG